MAEFFNQNLPMVLCLLFGTIFLIVEAFMPGFGIAGIAGTVLNLAAVVFMYLHNGPAAALILLVVILIILAVVICLSLRSIKKGKLSKSTLVLNDEEHIGDIPDASVFSGNVGKTVTPLRPMGIAEFGDARVNVTSEDGFIPAGSQVRVIHTIGSKVIVRKQED